ncbi:putative nitronate monooxygenase [Candida tropicalis]
MSSKLKLLQKLGIEYPIFLSPMAGVSTIELIAAITNNGGLGSIPLASIDFRQDDGVPKLDKLIEEYSRVVKKQKNIVNLNFFCHEIESTPTTEQIQNWKKLYSNVLNIKEEILNQAKFTNGNVSFKEVETNYEARYNRLLKYLENLKPKVASFHFGIPSQETIQRLQKIGTMVFVSSTSLEETKKLVECGVDGIILQGYEAGGHRGNFLISKTFDENLSTQALFIQSKKYIDTLDQQNVPFLVPAGGIVDSETINYYLEQGSDAVQLGTAFLATPESTNSKFFTTAKTKDRSNTIMIDLVSGKQARTVRTEFIDGLINKNGYPLNELPGYGYMYNAYKSLKPLVNGQDIGFYLAGQNYHQIETNKSAEEIMQKLINGLNK